MAKAPAFKGPKKSKKERMLKNTALRYEIFARSYVANGGVGTQAAIDAGYAPTSAGQESMKLLKKAAVKKLIAKYAKEISDKIEIDNEWLLRKLIELAETNIDDFLVTPTDGSPPFFDLGRATRQQKAAIESLTLDTSRGRTIRYSEDGEEDVVYSTPINNRIAIKMTSKLKALEMIGRHVMIQAFNQDPQGGVKNPAALQPLNFIVNPVTTTDQKFLGKRKTGKGK